MEPRVTRWSGAKAPTERALRLVLQEDGLSPYSWENGPFDQYAPHSHTYDKVICVVSGTITFALPDEGCEVELRSGDWLELPPGTIHSAVVGRQGVVCLEAHRN